MEKEGWSVWRERFTRRVRVKRCCVYQIQEATGGGDHAWAGLHGKNECLKVEAYIHSLSGLFLQGGRDSIKGG